MIQKYDRKLFFPLVIFSRYRQLQRKIQIQGCFKVIGFQALLKILDPCFVKQSFQFRQFVTQQLKKSMVLYSPRHNRDLS